MRASFVVYQLAKTSSALATKQFHLVSLRRLRRHRACVLPLFNGNAHSCALLSVDIYLGEGWHTDDVDVIQL